MSGRWEWRTFGEDFGAADGRFDALEPDRVDDSHEVYLLSSESDSSVKLRDGKLDVKELQQVSEDGLEQWLPVLKAELSVSSDDLQTLLGALNTDQVIAVEVHKHRRHYDVGGCMAELSEITTSAGSVRTIVLESEDPDVVRATIADLGLAGRRNVSLPRGLKTLHGFGAHRYAVLDVGTNSVKFHVGERRADGSWETVADGSEVTRLGEGLQETGELQPEPMRRTAAAIARFVDEARRDGAEAIAAVGTAGMRRATNRAELVDAVRERTGVEIEVISGEEEARLAYVAAVSSLELPPGPLVVFDSGGGSSQFTFGDGRRVDEQFSVDVGAVRYTERFGLDGKVSEDVLHDALDAIAADLGVLDEKPKPNAVVALGGAATNLASVKHGLAQYDPAVIHGTVLDVAEIDRQIELYRTRTADERRSIPGLQPGREQVILAGACIVRTVITKLGRESATVSDRGLRHGLIVERFGGYDGARTTRTTIVATNAPT